MYYDTEEYEYTRGFDCPEYIFTAKELVEILHERRQSDPEYRKDLDDAFILKLEAKERDEPVLMTVT